MEKRMLLCACLITGMMLGTPANAEVEYIPNPSSIVTNDFFTLGTPTTTKPSGSYVLLSAVDKATNPWTVTDGYSTFTLNKTSYIYGDGSHDLSPVNVNVPNTDTPVTLTVKYETSEARVGDMTSDIGSGSGPTIVFAELSDTYGGAIYNSGAGDYSITNTAFLNNSSDWGGAIMNWSGAQLGDITNSIFINNTSTNNAGAIYGNTGSQIGDIINSTFIKNSANSAGAIYSGNGAQIGDIINSTFIGNSANSSGGAIYGNTGSQIGDIINSTFINNSANWGGVIGTRATIGNITNSTFINNSANYGGVIYNNQGTVGDIINSTFINNSANYAGVVIYNMPSESKIGDIINSTFISNSGWGVIINGAKMGNIINSTFINNISTSTAGAICNYYGTIGDITNSNFINNSATTGGAIYNYSGSTIGNIQNSTFINNTAGTRGGAIYALNDVNITSDGGTTIFQGNTDSTGSNAIYMDDASKTVTLDHKNGGKTYMYDVVDGAAGYTVDIKGNGTMYLFNDINNANVSIGGVELNTINNDIHTYNFDSLTLTKDFNMAVDVDLKNQKMDRLTAETVSGTGKINVVGMNLLNDPQKPSVKILFADNNLKERVNNKVNYVGYDSDNQYQMTALSPIFKYKVNYKIENDGGYYTFAGGGGGNNPDNYNPAVLSTPAVAQAQIMQLNNIVTNYAFHHVDTCMGHAHGIDSIHATRYANKYAIAETDLIKDDLNTNNPLFIEPKHESVWFKPFASFENIPLRNGPNVKTINYGALVGYDSQVFNHKHGWDGVWTGYVGYTGSNMHYSGVDSTSNGGLLGATYSLYKGNFFNATTLTAGAMNAEARTMYGNDHMTSLYGGIGNKTGYNINFKEGLFTLQPSLLLSYTFGKTFDYTNSAGVRINSDPIHAIQVSPGLKFFVTTKNGWQPYLAVNMMWNIMDRTHVRANNVSLPNMSVKPYIQYGIGLQKVMKDNFTAYGQAMIQNGGRNGISLTAGFKWALGHNRHKVKNVYNPNAKKTVLKTL